MITYEKLKISEISTDDGKYDDKKKKCYKKQLIGMGFNMIIMGKIIHRKYTKIVAIIGLIIAFIVLTLVILI